LNGAALQPFGWIVHRHSSKSGYPATQGLFRVLVLPYLFKNFAIKNWLRFCELYGAPIRVLFHHEKDEAKKNELKKALRELGANGAALLEGGTGEDLKTVDAVKGEGQGFESLIRWAEGSISKAILGGTLTSETATNGNRSLGDVHNEVRYQIRGHDARQIAETVNRQLIGAIALLNGLEKPGRFVFDTQEPEDLALYADALPKLAGIGLQIPSAWAHEKLKIPIPDGNEPMLSASTQAKPDSTLPNQAQPGQAGLSAGHRCGVRLSVDNSPVFTPQQQAVENLADGMLATLDGPLGTAAIQSAIRSASDPQDLEERLAAVLKGTDTAEFQRLLAYSLFAADILGYAHAEGK